jgi:DNA-binding GntR family transcriptional regulator
LVYIKEYISYNVGIEIPRSPGETRVTKTSANYQSTSAAEIASDRDESPNQVRSDSTYNELRELIVSGRLSPGARLVEGEIARRLGVSRTPVRSALHRLQQEGYVVPSNAGNMRTRLVVAPMTFEDAEDLFNIIGELEGLAGRYAAQLDEGSRQHLADELTRLNSALLAESRSDLPDPKRAFEIDAGLHRQLVETASPPRLLALHNAIKPQVDRYARLYLSSLKDELPLSIAEHSEVISRLREGDVEGTRNNVQLNWRNGAKRLSTVIESLGERGVW